MVYKPKIAKIIPWQEIASHYAKLISEGWRLIPMLDLVQYIRNNGFSERLYGYTTFYDRLVITIYNPGEWDKESLSIAYNPDAKKFYFTYRAKPDALNEVARVCVEEGAITKFRQFIEWLNW